ncbi:MAG: endonuclease domain-containing protein [Proteobacteria bacterium]|nr:endonuclease domain-containing protein [Pseudomonadota bacterium]
MTLSEVLIWKELYRKKFLGLNFDRQKVIGNYIVDFYCPDIGMVVEIDGDSHDFKEKYDTKRDTYLESLGLIVIHLGDLEIKKNISWPLSILYEETKKRMQNLGMTTPET